MKHRILALVCLLAVLAGVLTLGVTAETQTERYQVGYAIKDINPWADPTNKVYDEEAPEGLILAVPMSGYANSSERPSGSLADDNGDGVIDNTDGLQVTCTSVTDAWGTTVMYFTVDAISGYSGTTKDLRAAMVEALGSDVIKESQIMFCGSHTHEGADLDTCRAAEAGTDQRNYYDYALSQMVAAGVEAYSSRTEAVMTKGEIDASESSGYQLNYVRHYNVEEQKKVNGEWTVTNSFVGGSNFGGSKTETSTSSLIRTVENVSESNDTMYLLQFAPTNGDAPIVLVNWRAHATLYGGGSTDATISSDYVNSLRYQLEKAGYRAAFIQSASGNVNARRVSTAMTPWCSATVSADVLPNPTTANLYGYLLSQVALDCLENNMTEELEPGKIHTMQTSFSAAAQTDSEGLLAAADAWYEAVQAGETITYPYDEYTHTDGQTYIINSKYHANNIRSRRNNVEGVTRRSFELNAISMGPSVAMVTSPCEMFDRYSLSATLDDTTQNDWLNLVNDKSYGTPWLLGYTNAHLGYIPNSLAYTYNEGHSTYGVGAYEANTSRVAQGEGEKFIVSYAHMLKVVTEGYKTDYCQHCDAEVEWTPWTVERVSAGTLETGHYYLVEDIPEASSTQQGFAQDAVVCLDLNGYNISTKGRTFSMSNNCTLSIMGEGTVTSREGGNNPGSGLISVGSGCTLNLYGGTLTAVNTGEANISEIGKAGVVGLHGTMNVYGGTVKGANLALSSYFTERNDAENGCGAGIYIYTGGTLNMYGGHAQAGSVPEGSKGICIYIAGTKSYVNLSGDAVADEIYFNYNSGANLTVADAYSGTAALNFNSTNVTLSAGLDIGNASSADLTGSRLTCVNDSTYDVGVYGTELKLNQWTAGTVATYYGAQGVKHFTSLTAAAAVSGTDYVKLHKNETKAVTISKDTCLELNGHSVTGAVTVADGATLYGMDAQTDDLDVTDGNYGRLTSVTGNVAGAARNAAGDEAAYMKITEADGVSFHRANMEITAMTLRASQAGVYYKSTFKTNDVAAAHVAQFGVALSVVAAPTAENLKEDCQCSVFTDFTAAQDTYTGTLLRWVMHAGNSASTNRANADMPVYGRAYMLTDEGQHVFGKAVSRSFREQVEGVDALWDTLTDVQKEEVRSLYMNNLFVMKSWNIPNIRAAFGTDSGDIPFDNLIQ